MGHYQGAYEVNRETHAGSDPPLQTRRRARDKPRARADGLFPGRRAGIRKECGDTGSGTHGEKQKGFVWLLKIRTGDRAGATGHRVHEWTATPRGSSRTGAGESTRSWWRRV